MKAVLYKRIIRFLTKEDALITENKELKEALMIPYGGPAYDNTGKPLDDYVIVHLKYVEKAHDVLSKYEV